MCVFGWDSFVVEGWSFCLVVGLVLVAGQGGYFGELTLAEIALPGDLERIVRQVCFQLQPPIEHPAWGIEVGLGGRYEPLNSSRGSQSEPTVGSRIVNKNLWSGAFSTERGAGERTSLHKGIHKPPVPPRGVISTPRLSDSDKPPGPNEIPEGASPEGPSPQRLAIQRSMFPERCIVNVLEHRDAAVEGRIARYTNFGTQINLGRAKRCMGALADPIRRHP